MSSLLDVRRMRYFVAVAEELNFRRAAERLRISQPPLSQQIAGLEEELHAKLFERDRQRVHLTAAGRLLLDRARRILSDVESTRLELQEAASGTGGDLRVGFTASAGLMPFLHRALQAFRRASPGVHLLLSELPSMAQFEALHKRQLDLAIVRKPPLRVGNGLEVVRLREDRLVVAVHEANPIINGPTLRIKQLEREPLIAYPREAGISLFQTIYRMVTAAGFYPKIVHEARDSATIIGLVAAGQGVAIVPESLRCIAVPGVRFLPLEEAGARSALFLARLTAVGSGPATALHEALQQHAAGSDRPLARREPRPPREARAGRRRPAAQ